MALFFVEAIMSKRRYDLSDYNITRQEVFDLIDSYIFNERNRAILKRFLTDGVTQERLSEEFDLSITQIKNILNKEESRLFSHIK